MHAKIVGRIESTIPKDACLANCCTKSRRAADRPDLLRNRRDRDRDRRLCVMALWGHGLQKNLRDKGGPWPTMAPM